MEITADGAAIQAPGTSAAADAAGLEHVQLQRHLLRWSISIDGHRIALPKLRGRAARAIQLELRRTALGPAIAAAVDWHRSVNGAVAGAVAAGRWLPSEQAQSLLDTRPAAGLAGRARATGVFETLDETEASAAEALDEDLWSRVEDINEEITSAELRDRHRFLDTIESKPLTEEQARAVIAYDNRVQLLAAAGSGKTSVMVARAAYAIERGFTEPDRILLLAYNAAAADELAKRIKARFSAAGIDATGIKASTFHAFGLGVIGDATGAKPRIARWVDQSDETATIAGIVDGLRAASADYAYLWDLYRTLFATAPIDLTDNEPDSWDRQTGASGLRTFRGELVRSHGERLIANYLYLNGVAYEYERPYEHNTADARHSQYQPDFYYPGIDAWHEHWALDRDGNPPPDFDGYADGIEWKRRCHERNGTTLIETTWAGVMFGSGLAELGTRLQELGLTLDWDPNRPVSQQWAKPLRYEDLIARIRSFLSHIKANGWTPQDLDERLAGEAAHLDGYRTRLFCALFWPVFDQWQALLNADDSIDFDDMLVGAAAHLEAGDTDPGFDLVLVDEFQDASRARARLVRALVDRPGRHLLAVGDDWQSINRFAGADLAVMTGFESWFGRSTQLALTATFRCTQTICDTASAFVSKNPAQMRKEMRSVAGPGGAAVTVVRSQDPSGAVASVLRRISAGAPPGAERTVTVDVLGRYRHQRDLVPRSAPGNLKVTFRTVHGSKGLEADYVIVPEMGTGRYGFPSGITDDPVLALAMPEPDPYPFGEERRLLYVALTRARHHVTLIAPASKMSPFIDELLAEPGVEVVDDMNAPVDICLSCRHGVMVKRFRRRDNRPFYGCSSWPGCTQTRPYS